MNTSALAGKWVLVSWTNKSNNKIYYPFGKHPEGWLKLTNNEFVALTQKDTSSIEKGEQLNTPFYNDNVLEFSSSGTYKLKDDEIILEYKESSVAELNHTQRTRKYNFDGHRTLIIWGDKTIGNEICSVSGTYLKVD